jgi:hypothetical protein
VQKSTEDTTAMFITESLHAALRASALKTEPGEQLHFFFDGLKSDQATTDLKFTSNNFFGNVEETDNNVAIGIPGPRARKSIKQPSNSTEPDGYRDYLSKHLDECYARLGQNKSSEEDSNNRFGLVAYNPDADHIPLQQYSYNIEIAAPAGNPTGLYDITFRIRRNNKVIKVFYTQLMIPTSIGNNSL